MLGYVGAARTGSQRSHLVFPEQMKGSRECSRETGFRQAQKFVEKRGNRGNRWISLGDRRTATPVGVQSDMAAVVLGHRQLRVCRC